MISVVMLTYNRKGLAGQMISDILNQSYRDFEYIIVNNGSTDGTDEMLKGYAESDGRIKLVMPKDRVSIGKGRNIGIQYAKGDFVAFVDDDDRVDGDFLEFLAGLQREEQADIAMCGTDEWVNGCVKPQCVYEDKLVLGGREAVLELLKREHIRAGAPTKLFRKELLLKFPFDESAKSEDMHTMYKYFADTDRVALHGIPKYHIIRHGENNSAFTSDDSKWTPELLREYLDAYRRRSAYLCEKFPEESGFFAYTVWSFELSMCHKIAENGLDGCGGLYAEMKKDIGENWGSIINCEYMQDFEKEWLEELT